MLPLQKLQETKGAFKEGLAEVGKLTSSGTAAVKQSGAADYAARAGSAIVSGAKAGANATASATSKAAGYVKSTVETAASSTVAQDMQSSVENGASLPRVQGMVICCRCSSTNLSIGDSRALSK